MAAQSQIARKLTEALAPVALDIVDESEQHAGHAGYREGGGTHFRVRVVADAFAGKSRIERQRMVYALLAEEFDAGLHALSITARTPAEAESRGAP